MTPKENQLYSILSNYMDSEGNVSMTLGEMGYPNTPDFINQAETDLQSLLTLDKITSFERTSSRNFKICVKIQ